jgi:hypothetical protein
MSIVWHYTYSHRIADILRSGTLLPPRMVPDRAAHEYASQFTGHKDWEADKKLLLFSAKPVWEPASYRAWQKPNGEVTELYALSDYADYGVTVYRIGVDNSILKPWQRLKTLSRMSRHMAQSLERVAVSLGSNPYDWWGTLFPVPSEQWESIEEYGNGEWKPFGVQEEAACPPLTNSSHCSLAAWTPINYEPAPAGRAVVNI